LETSKQHHEQTMVALVVADRSIQPSQPTMPPYVPFINFQQQKHHPSITNHATSRPSTAFFSHSPKPAIGQTTCLTMT